MSHKIIFASSLWSVPTGFGNKDFEQGPRDGFGNSFCRCGEGRRTHMPPRRIAETP